MGLPFAMARMRLLRMIFFSSLFLDRSPPAGEIAVKEHESISAQIKHLRQSEREFVCLKKKCPVLNFCKKRIVDFFGVVLKRLS